jgi:Uma2 family endonuclease
MTVKEPHIHLWTRDEYLQMDQLGWFTNKRVELIEGVVVEMSPIGSRHAAAVVLVLKALEAAFGPSYHARPQSTLDLGLRSQPEPDIALVVGEARAYTRAHPTVAQARVVVEVSDTTLDFDRREKFSMYAKAGVAEYWILNLTGDQLEVYRDPGPDERALYGYGYATAWELKAGATIAPLALPDVQIAIADLLP